MARLAGRSITSRPLRTGMLFAAVCLDGCAASAGYVDLERFIARREKCDHFRGEDGYDRERAHFVAANVKRYCTGTDRELARLKLAYANNAAATAMLNAYESSIE